LLYLFFNPHLFLFFCLLYLSIIHLFSPLYCYTSPCHLPVACFLPFRYSLSSL
jgi:hypothetical protein